MVGEIYGDRRPARPDGIACQRGLSDFIWDIMEACWRTDPSERPGMEDVSLQLNEWSLTQKLLTATGDDIIAKTVCRTIVGHWEFCQTR